MEVKPPGLYEFMTGRPTNRQTNRLGQKEVTLPIRLGLNFKRVCQRNNGSSSQGTKDVHTSRSCYVGGGGHLIKDLNHE